MRGEGLGKVGGFVRALPREAPPHPSLSSKEERAFAVVTPLRPLAGGGVGGGGGVVRALPHEAPPHPSLSSKEERAFAAVTPLRPLAGGGAGGGGWFCQGTTSRSASSPKPLLQGRRELLQLLLPSARVRGEGLGEVGVFVRALPHEAPPHPILSRGREGFITRFLRALITMGSGSAGQRFAGLSSSCSQRSTIARASA